MTATLRRHDENVVHFTLPTSVSTTTVSLQELHDENGENKNENCKHHDSDDERQWNATQKPWTWMAGTKYTSFSSSSHKVAKDTMMKHDDC